MSLSTEAVAERFTITLRAVSEIANAYYFRGDLNAALRLFQTSEQWLSVQEILPQDRLNFLLKYGQFLISYYFIANREEDLMNSVVQRAMEAADSSQDQAGIATALYLKGQALYYHHLLTMASDYTDARDYLQRASALYEQIGDSYNLAESLFYTGLTYDRKNPDKRSEEHYLRALSLAEQHGNKWAASEATRHLTDYTDGEQRLRYALRSLELREAMGFKRGLPAAQQLVSEVYIARGDLAHALEYCRQAELLSEEMGLQTYLMAAFLTYGEIAYKQGKIAEAREHIEKAAVLARDLNIARWLSLVDEKLAMLAGE